MVSLASAPTWNDIARQQLPARGRVIDPARFGASFAQPPLWENNALAIDPMRTSHGRQEVKTHSRVIRFPAERIVAPHQEGKAVLTAALNDLLDKLWSFWIHSGAHSLTQELGRLKKSRQLLLNAHSRLNELAHLKPDWDSYGGVPPTSMAIASAYQVLLSTWTDLADIGEQQIVPWTTAPLHRGGIQFEWKGAGGIVEVEIGPRGQISYLIEHEDGTIQDSEDDGEVSVREVVRCVRGVLGR